MPPKRRLATAAAAAPARAQAPGLIGPARAVLHVLVPGLPWPDPSDPRPASDLRLPALERLLARGGRLPAAPGCVERWLAEAWGLGTALPAAALRLRALDEDTGDGHWLCADPVHLQARGTELFLSAVPALHVQPDEAEALLATLETFFAPDGLAFRAAGPERWLVRLSGPTDLATTPLSAAHGRAVDALLPTGADARVWIARMNEAQMLLHDHPVNAAREARGEPALNSLWFWGEGRLGAPAAPLPARVFAGPGLVADAAAGLGMAVAPLPATADAALGPATRDPVLLCWAACGEAAARGDAAAWRAALDTLDRGLLAPALSNLAAGLLDEVRLTALDGRHATEVRLRRTGLLRLWRRPLPLARALPPAGATG